MSGAKPLHTPLTERQQRNQRRLAAFTNASLSWRSSTKLRPANIEGFGRVIIDHSNEADSVPIASNKKSHRRRKTVKDEACTRNLPLVLNTGDARGPNWLDSQFPWVLRSAAHAVELQRKEAERLHWIKRFLERESDDEEESEIMPSANWGEVYEDPPMPFRTGRGKMVPLSKSAASRGRLIKSSAYFPSDPADARAALLSKRAVRRLSDRKRHGLVARHEDLDDEEHIICACGGTDDGRELVQCDSCQDWYHWECIGVATLADLGSEDDPWYCANCESKIKGPRTPSPTFVPAEPTFVPTEEKRTFESRTDHPFLASLRDSPVTPYPARSMKSPRSFSFENDPSSGIIWNETSKFAPHTPSFLSSGSRFDSLDSDILPYDSLASPARLPFATPRLSWHRNLLQTPSRSSLTSPNKLLAYEHSNAPYNTPIQRSSVTRPAKLISFANSPSVVSTTGTSQVFPTSQSSNISLS